ncbi:MAG: hypothetical protein RLZZ511_2657 [Cyanobacteriota bacterium]
MDRTLPIGAIGLEYGERRLISPVQPKQPVTQPCISIILPVYNAAPFVAQTLRHILAQSLSQWELIAVDDGSTDQSWPILQQLAQHDQRIRVIRQANQGVAAARNRAIALAQADLIAPIDADDLWHPDFLAAHWHCHQRHPDIGVSYAWSLDIDPADAVLGGFQAATVRCWVADTLRCHNFLGNGSCTVMRRSLLRTIGGYRPQFGAKANPVMGTAICEDWDLYLRLAALAPFYPVRQFLVGYRKQPDSASTQRDRMAYWYGELQAAHPCPHLRPWVTQLSQWSFQRYLQRQSPPPLSATAPFPTPPPRHLVLIHLQLTRILHWSIGHFGHRTRVPAPTSLV